MHKPGLLLALASTFVSVSAAMAADLSGTVTGPDGAPFRAAFVQARNNALKMTVSVLTDAKGSYRIDHLPAGTYSIRIRATGFKADAANGRAITEADHVAQNFSLQKAPIRWSEISQLQGEELLPEAPGKKTWIANCFGCHGFQSKMASVVRDEDGWRDRVNFMREAMKSSLGERRGFDDAQAEEVVKYLTAMFSEDSQLPKSPADLPAYAGTVFKVPDEALNIVYVDYDMPGANRFPWTAQPDKDGLFWTPEYGQANKISRLNAETGEIVEFQAPNLGPALIHSAVPAPDGSVWLTEAGSKKLGRWDPNSQAIEEYQDTWRKHTIKIHPDGRIWSTGGLTVFDPKTKSYTHIAEAPNTYGIDLDSKKNVWFTEMMKGGKVGVIDPATLKVTKFAPPTDGRPRRIVVAPDDIVWFAEFDASKIGRVDPKTGTVKEFDLPFPHTKPYALKMSRDGMLWYSSEARDVIGRFDPASGNVVEFPMPYTDNGMRDFFPDGQGRLWYASPPNNKVGYFYFAAAH